MNQIHRGQRKFEDSVRFGKDRAVRFHRGGHGEHGHQHGPGSQSELNDFTDYTTAVNEYKKTFATKEQVLEQTPDPAVREMLLHMQEIGCETVFDRFEKQKPQCTFGMAGVCCKNCCMGPCRITPKSPKGVCGANADVIVARNMLRAVAAGAASHGARGRESMLALKYAAEGKIPVPIEGKEKIISASKAFGIYSEEKTIEQLADEIADILLEDLSRPVPDTHKTIQAFAAPERIETWEKLGIMPISTYHEVFESLHRTTTGTDSDWKNIMKQFLRTGLAFVWSSCFGSGVAMDCLYGLPTRSVSKVNVGALKKGYVNIAVHGHSPLLVREIVRIGNTEEYQKKAQERGAKGIQFYGICCSGLSAMYRYSNVIPLCNSIGAELVVGTGALDLWVADVQDIFPSILDVAKCFKTVVVTTSDSNRLPGAEHYGLEHDHSNLDQIQEIAEKIVNRGIEAFEARRDVPVCIPQYECEAEVGFSVEYITKHYHGFNHILEALKNGSIYGIINLVGCSNPRIVYEKAVVEVAEELLKHNILIFTNGCASFPLMKLGFCSKKAQRFVGDGMKEFLGDLPPVWHMGECLDNARASGMFGGIAGAAGKAIKDMPYAFVSPEWSNEKGINAALAFRLQGISSYHCVHAPIQGSKNVSDFMTEGTKDLLGSRMVVNVDHKELVKEILNDIGEKRRELGWEA